MCVWIYHNERNFHSEYGILPLLTLSIGGNMRSNTWHRMASWHPSTSSNPSNAISKIGTGHTWPILPGYGIDPWTRDLWDLPRKWSYKYSPFTVDHIWIWRGFFLLWHSPSVVSCKWQQDFLCQQSAWQVSYKRPFVGKGRQGRSSRKQTRPNPKSSM